MTNSLGWQSWSPPTPSLPRYPYWDYPPCSNPPLAPSSSPATPKPGISLWCSWHQNGPHLSESLVLAQATRFALLRRKLALAWQTPTLAHRLDPDAATNSLDADFYHSLWQAGKIAIFGLGYNL